MRQRKLDRQEALMSKEKKLQIYEARKSQWDGSQGSMIPRSVQDDTPDKREIEFRRLWNEGGFAFWTSNYMDLFGVKESNDIVYQWWRDQIKERVHDARKASILAPEVAPYAFGTKRVPLEERYYEAFNLPKVEIVDLKADGIKEIQFDGVFTQSGTLYEIDVLIMATGFNISTGSFDNIDIRGRNGVKLTDKWATQTRTYLGVSVNGFPNMLFPYGPQSPSNTCNGPVCAEIQGKWIIHAIEFLKASSGKTRIEASVSDESEYTELVSGMLKGSLFEGTHSYYHADNMPQSQGKKRQPVFWMGGLPAYIEKLETVAKSNYKGFQIL
jgi:cation diffusion facilitator CzcD-associated flavoprotein CzcO